MHERLKSIGQDIAFEATAAPYLVLDTDLRIRAVNPAYLEATLRCRDELIGEFLFEAFPDDPENPEADGVQNLGMSLERVLRSGRRHNMWVQRYDIPHPEDGDQFIKKTWSPINSPIHAEDGRVVGALHHVEDITVLDDILEAERGDGRDEPIQPVRLSPQQVRAVALAAARCRDAHADLSDENKNLQIALTSRATIEQAKGILMAEWRCGPGEAFERLVKLSQDSNIKLRSLAAALVYRVSYGSGSGPTPTRPDVDPSRSGRLHG